MIHKKTIKTILYFVFLCYINFSLSGQEYISFSHSPGFYNEDINLVLSTVDPAIEIYYCFDLRDHMYLWYETHPDYGFYPGNKTMGPWVSFSDSIGLTAVNGEQAFYNLKVRAYKNHKMLEELDITYGIDKKRPFPPILNTPQGEYQENITLSFINKEDSNERVKISYSINSIVLETGIVWNERSFVLKGEYGKKKEYTIQAYALDEVNNRSEVITYHYTINMTSEANIAPVLDIKSPVPGSFENKQLLYITSYNLQWIKYSIDGSDPEVSGLFYTEPILLDATGDISLRVAGMPRLAASFPLQAEVFFAVNAKGTGDISINKISGNYYSDTTVFLTSGKGKIFNYTLEEHSPTEMDMVTKGEITLQGNKDESTFIPLRVRTISSGVKLGNEYRFFYCIHKKSPVITRIDVFNPGPESTYADVEIKGTKGAQIYYTLDGSIPDTSSFPYTGAFRITRKQAYPHGYVMLSVIAYDSYRSYLYENELHEKKSDVVWRKIPFQFTYPQVPEVKVSSGERTNLDVIVNIGDKENIVYEISNNGTEPPDLSRESEKAYENLVFSLPYGIEKKFIVKCASTDKDLFTISPSVRFEFIIDRLPPFNPVAQGVPENGFTQQPVAIYFKETDGTIYYRLTDDGLEPQLGGSESPMYTGPFTVYGRENGEVTYRIKALAIDDLQNISFTLQEIIFKIDKNIPAPPGAPVVKLHGQDIGGLYSISWKPPEEEAIYYTLHNAGHDLQTGDDQFLLYTGPLIIDFSEKTNGIILRSFIKDFAGNKSKTVSFKVHPTGKKMEAPSVTGVVDEGSYNKPVTIELKAAKGNIYYELTDNGTNPPYISTSSSLYEKPVVLDINDGESGEYRLRACVIEDTMWNVTSKELYIRFFLDKIPPDPPRIREMENGGYFYEKATVSFYPTEDTIYYELIPAHKYSDIIVPQEFMVYDSKIILDTPDGTVQHFIILAFSVDKAGNLSKERPEWRVGIDKNSIFVSPSGSDLDYGTRAFPFATINRAIDFSEQCGRNLIILAHGVYKMRNHIDVKKEITIRGGFNPFSWDPGVGGDLSIIDSSDLYISMGFLFNQTGALLSFNKVEFRDSIGILPGFIRNSGGKTVLEDVKVLLENQYSVSAIAASDGIVEISNSEFNCEKSEYGSFVTTDKSNLYIFSSVFSGPGEGKEFTALKMKHNKECMLQDVSISPGQAFITRGADIDDSMVLFQNCRIDTGSGTNNAVGMRVSKSVVNIQMSVIHCDNESKYSMGISSDNSKLTIDSSLININGKSGATGIRVKDGLINVFLSTIKSNPIPDFLYLFDLENEKGSFVGNLITGSDAGDSLCCILNNSETFWINNTIIAGNSNTTTSAFLINGDKSPHFINNIIARNGTPSGNAFHFIGGTKVNSLISNNTFSGWETILKIDFIKGITGSYTYATSQEFHKSTTDAFNMYDGDSYGGNIRDNISENFDLIFLNPGAGNYHLSPLSSCVNNGMDVRGYIFSGIVMDFDGEERPAKIGNMRPNFDIGADEFYEE